MIIKVRAEFGTIPFIVDGVVSLRGNKVCVDEISEIILEGDDFCVDTFHADGKTHIILQ